MNKDKSEKQSGSEVTLCFSLPLSSLLHAIVADKQFN
jgi:hypothetical protein